MTLPIFLAHGALGPWDEIIFLSVFVVFLVIMGIAWVRSRVIGDRDVDDDEPAASSEAPADDSPDRFTLQ
ncbi:MAG: hypothetical protein IT298_01780 [Chloroflexi bacterium]|jgi:hypothetical protein|nr:MAG: hypothetical protein UZ13_00708 [Chloroflexi bacterium OLB13]MBC6955940.1 hypothetical protein [Chloroflexota bacterium]MBV6436882.1 hypothetical protein [Anaerolineae bacterium]OQY81776.1 MAG: hypothetical protein B6D42_10595 [Anaerolineae bacterium UTCFX5]MBW7877811.1 hypothetical protein [Anaerolineae bacterium]